MSKKHILQMRGQRKSKLDPSVAVDVPLACVKNELDADEVADWACPTCDTVGHMIFNAQMATHRQPKAVFTYIFRCDTCKTCYLISYVPADEPVDIKGA